MIVNHTFSEEVLNEVNLLEDFLTEYNQLLPSAIVAGGAPRDWFFNSISTDIDIFISGISDLKSLDAVLRTDSEITELDLKTTEELPANYRSENIQSVLSFKYSGKPFQVILTQHVGISILLTFPTSISRIYYKDYRIHPSAIFIKTIHKARLFYYNLDEHTLPYLNKISMKFSNFRTTRTPKVEMDALTF